MEARFVLYEKGLLPPAQQPKSRLFALLFGGSVVRDEEPQKRAQLFSSLGSDVLIELRFVSAVAGRQLLEVFLALSRQAQRPDPAVIFGNELENELPFLKPADYPVHVVRRYPHNRAKTGDGDARISTDQT